MFLQQPVTDHGEHLASLNTFPETRFLSGFPEMCHLDFTMNTCFPSKLEQLFEYTKQTFLPPEPPFLPNAFMVFKVQMGITWRIDGITD